MRSWQLAPYVLTTRDAGLWECRAVLATRDAGLWECYRYSALTCEGSTQLQLVRDNTNLSSACYARALPVCFSCNLASDSVHASAGAPGAGCSARHCRKGRLGDIQPAAAHADTRYGNDHRHCQLVAEGARGLSLIAEWPTQ